MCIDIHTQATCPVLEDDNALGTDYSERKGD